MVTKVTVLPLLRIQRRCRQKYLGVAADLRSKATEGKTCVTTAGGTQGTSVLSLGSLCCWWWELDFPRTRQIL